MAPPRLSFVVNNQLTPLDEHGSASLPITIGSSAWYDWLADARNRSFSLHTEVGWVTVRREQKRNDFYWYACRKQDRKLRKAYLGKSQELTPERLHTAVMVLIGRVEQGDVQARAEFIFLGQPRLIRDDRLIDFNTTKAIGLLAYLALHNTPQSRDQLLALLWPESAEMAARKNLRNMLWTIRRALGNVVRQEDQWLALHKAVRVDVHLFERSAQANKTPTQSDLHRITADHQRILALYHGPLLDGLSFREAPEFELWVATERERLDQLYLRTLQTLIQNASSSRQWSDVVTLARRALTTDPLQEPIYRTLMEAHAHLGERLEALRAYDTLRITLQRELGVAPLPETDDLREAIATGSLSPMTPMFLTHQGEELRTQQEASRRGQGVGPAPFVGREAERAALDVELKAADGQMRMVVLRGELGIGKTRLWQTWAAERLLDHPIMELRCRETTQDLLFAPLITWFYHSGIAQRLFGPQSPLSPIWLAELARLIPDLPTRRSDVPVPAVLAPSEERRRMFEAFTQMLLALQARPLVIFIDDLHWVDSATLDMLNYLAGRLREYPLLLVAAYRPEEASAKLVQSLATWEREEMVQHLLLQRLTQTEARALIAALGGEQQRFGQLYEQSAGNPYFLGELLRGAPDTVPPALADLVHARLARLPEQARQVLQAAVILDPDADFHTLRRTSGRSEEETLDALDVLLQAAVLIEQDQHYTFVHPLVATVVRKSLTNARRAVLHQRAAESLEATYATRLAMIAGTLSTHYRAAGNASRAAHYADRAAEQALTMAAWAEAAGWYEEAYACEPTPQRQLSLGRAQFWQGHLDQARTAFHAAREAFDRQENWRGAGRACLDLAGTYMSLGRADEVMYWVECATTYLGREDDPATRAWAHFLLGSAQRDSAPVLDSAEDHLEKAVQLSIKHGLPEVRSRSLVIIGDVYLQRGDLLQARHAFENAIEQAHLAQDPLQEALAQNEVARLSILTGNLEVAHQQLEAGQAIIETYALELPRAYLYVTRGELALVEEQWNSAEAWLTDGRAAAEQHQQPLQAASAQASLGRVAWGRGELDQAIWHLEAARAEALPLAARRLQTHIDLWLAEVYSLRGERLAAEEALSRAEERLANSTDNLWAWVARIRQKVGIDRTV